MITTALFLLTLFLMYQTGKNFEKAKTWKLLTKTLEKQCPSGELESGKISIEYAKGVLDTHRLFDEHLREKTPSLWSKLRGKAGDIQVVGKTP